MTDNPALSVKITICIHSREQLKRKKMQGRGESRVAGKAGQRVNFFESEKKKNNNRQCKLKMKMPGHIHPVFDEIALHLFEIYCIRDVKNRRSRKYSTVQSMRVNIVPLMPLHFSLFFKSQVIVITMFSSFIFFFLLLFKTVLQHFSVFFFLCDRCFSS